MNHRALYSDDRDLAELVRAATDVAPSGGLLDRVHASRAEGLRVMLPHGDAATVPVAPARQPSAIDALTVEQLARRVWMIGLAVAATVVAAVTALWPRPRAESALATTARAVKTAAPQIDAVAADRERLRRELGLIDSASLDSAILDSLERVYPAVPPSESLVDRLSPWPRVAYAQTPGKAERIAPYPGNPQLDASRLQPGRRSYLRSVGNAVHDMLPYSTFTVTLDSTKLEGQRAWCLSTVTQTSRGLTENNDRDAQHDSVWLRWDNLRPIRRTRHAGFLRMRQQFSDSLLVETDSLIAPRGMTLQNGMRLMPFRSGTSKRLEARLPFVPTEETMRLLLRAAPLHATWRASVGVLTGDNRSSAMGESDYLNLRVDGTRDIQTLSGRFATWRVVLETGPKPEVWYVSKETGETLLTEGSWGVAYPVSETRLLYGYEETKRRPPAGTR